MKEKKIDFSNEEKIAAFDLIAEKFYAANFGSTSKTDFETLMFSIYIEKVLKENSDKPDSFSDYTLSKDLGITQEKINRLKVQKQLKYPRKEFNWKTAFIGCLKFAYIEKNKIKVFVDDPNILIELKHAIEMNGGFTDSSFNSKICVICPGDFLDLLCVIASENEIKEIRKTLQSTFNRNEEVIRFLENESLGVQLKRVGKELTLDILGDVLNTVPVVGDSLANLKTQIANLVENRISVSRIQAQINQSQE